VSLPVFWVTSLSDAVVGQRLEVTGQEGRHAAVVRRIGLGEAIAVTDGRGVRAACTVSSLGRSSVVAEVLSLSTAEPPAPRLVVVQALAKGERGELAVEMLTEVGADMIVPWAASRSVAVWRGDRGERSLARWRSTAHEAAKQSRRSWFPEVVPLAGTPDVVRLLRDAALAVVLHEEAAAPLASVEPPAFGDLVLVVGPEGGISSSELEAFTRVGATALRMGPTVLRTSTAGVAAAAALLARTDRWK
jgi:16S rRNA (uracil1498-N3)-methyltransferase